MMRFPLRTSIATVIAAGLIVAPGALADRSRHDDDVSRDHAPQPISAQEFLTKAAASNLFEIVTGRLAQERASSDAVKALGAEFVAHHTTLLEKGRAVATELGIVVPEALTPEQQRTVNRLEQRQGKRFDRAWLAAQIVAHQQALELNLRGAIRGEAPQIRTLAQGALPFITHHLGELLDLAGADGGHPGHHHGDRDDDHNGHRGHHYGDRRERHHGHRGHHHGGRPDRQRG